jgi:hypothetical protein
LWTNFAAELNIWDALKYRFSYSADLSFWGNDGSVPQTYYRSANNQAQYTSASSDSERGTVWQVENTLSYDKTFGDHHFAVVLGQSAFRNTSYGLSGNRNYLINPNKPSLNYATGDYHLSYQRDSNGNIVYATDANGNLVPIVTGAVVEHGVSGWVGSPHSMSSLFFRGSYDYARALHGTGDGAS